MNKLTKIVATIGPACDSPETIKKLIDSGVDIFRFNFKHNTVDWHDERIRRVNEIAKNMNRNIGTLIDLQGPELRVNMPVEAIKIEKDQRLIFGSEVFIKGNEDPGFSISHPQIIPELKSGQRILADDGSLAFNIEREDGQTFVRCQNAGVLKNHKNLNIVGADFSLPALVEKDFEGLKLVHMNEVDYVALSFVRTEKDIINLRREMAKYRLKAKVIAKIETEKALNHLDEIIKETDGIMVARGDLGVELPYEKVPYFQKIIIKKCIEKGTPVITATQMLQSMVGNPYPTRAEVSDVANATYDLTDAVMLSGETATGQYPVQTVNVMRNTVIFNEKKNLVDSRKRFNFNLEDQASILCDTAYELYFLYRQRQKQVSGFLVFTHTGNTARLLSRYRPLVPIFAFTPHESVGKSLIINYGVTAIADQKIGKKSEVTREQIVKAVESLKDGGLVKKGDLLIVLHGDYWTVEGGTSTLKLATV